MSNLPAVIKGALESESGQEKLREFFNGDTSAVQKFKSALINVASDITLQSCSCASVLKSAFSLAELGLSINKGLAHSYIIAYGSEAEPIISYKGWQILAKKAGIDVRAFCVFKCDTFKLDYSSFNGEVTFSPNIAERNEGDVEWFNKNILGVLVKTLENGIEKNFFVSKVKIEKLKGCSPAVKRGRSNSVYDKWAEEMYLAKAIKYTLSKMPLTESSIKLANAISLENDVEIRTQNNKTEKEKSEREDFENYLMQVSNNSVIDTETEAKG